MAIHGTLKRNPLSAILQKLTKADATGQLQILSDIKAGRKLRIDLRHGNVVFVKSGLRPPDMRLGQLIIRGGYATEEEVWECLSIAEQSRRPLGAVMIEEEFVEQDVVSELLRLQFLEDIIFSLGWKKGDFRFVEEEPKLRDAEPAISPKDFLTQALRYTERKATFDKLIPNNDIIFKQKVPSPLPESEIVKNKLTIEDVALFDILVHGTLSVSHLLPAMRQPMFEVAQTLRRLHEAGLIAQSEGGGTRTRVQVRRRTFKEAVVYHGLTTFVVTGAMALAVGLYLTYRSGNDGRAGIQPYDARKAALTRAQIDRIGNGLESFRINTGNYPSSLDVLVERGVIDAEDLRYPGYTRPYVYHPSGDTYILVRPKK